MGCIINDSIAEVPRFDIDGLLAAFNSALDSVVEPMSDALRQVCRDRHDLRLRVSITERVLHLTYTGKL